MKNYKKILIKKREKIRELEEENRVINRFINSINEEIVEDEKILNDAKKEYNQFFSTSYALIGFLSEEKINKMMNILKVYSKNIEKSESMKRKYVKKQNINLIKMQKLSTR